MRSYLPLIIVVLVWGLSLFSQRLSKNPLMVLLLAAITIYFFVNLFINNEQFFKFLLFSLVSLVTTIRYAISSGLLTGKKGMEPPKKE